MIMTLVEPSSRSLTAPTIFVGRTRRGGWIAFEQNGIFGGLFVNRAQAFKYALRENGHHPETIVELPREIEVDIPADPQITGWKAWHAERQAVELCCGSHETKSVTP